MNKQATTENIKNFVFSFEIDNRELIKKEELRGEFKHENDVDIGNKNPIEIEEDL